MKFKSPIISQSFSTKEPFQLVWLFLIRLFQKVKSQKKWWKPLIARICTKRVSYSLDLYPVRLSLRWLYPSIHLELARNSIWRPWTSLKILQVLLRTACPPKKPHDSSTSPSPCTQDYRKCQWIPTIHLRTDTVQNIRSVHLICDSSQYRYSRNTD